MLVSLAAWSLILTYRSLPYKVEKIDISKNTQKEEYVFAPLQIPTYTKQI